jgi:hypothetical protein
LSVNPIDLGPYLFRHHFISQRQPDICDVCANLQKVVSLLRISTAGVSYESAVQEVPLISQGAGAPPGVERDEIAALPGRQRAGNSVFWGVCVELTASMLLIFRRLGWL